VSAQSEHPEQADTPEQAEQAVQPAAAVPAPPATGARSERGGPEPEALRFFGTTWVDHGRGYALRRVVATVGSLATAFAACLIMRFAYDGVAIADVGAFVGYLLVIVFAVCSAIAFRKTWDGFSRRPADPAREESLRTLKTIGFIGSLIAYFLRSFTEAPGEKLRRTEYETALVAYERRRTARAGNPAGRGGGGGKGKKAKRK
jgi:hypothetical protein